MREHAFRYEVLDTPAELPPANGRADAPRVLNGYIVSGTSTWDRNAKRRRLTRLLAYVLTGGGWRA